MIIHISDAKPLTEEEIYRLVDDVLDRSGSISDEMINEMSEEVRKIFDKSKDVQDV